MRLTAARWWNFFQLPFPYTLVVLKSHNTFLLCNGGFVCLPRLYTNEGKTFSDFLFVARRLIRLAWLNKRSWLSDESDILRWSSRYIPIGFVFWELERASCIARGEAMCNCTAEVGLRPDSGMYKRFDIRTIVSKRVTTDVSAVVSVELSSFIKSLIAVVRSTAFCLGIDACVYSVFNGWAKRCGISKRRCFRVVVHSQLLRSVQGWVLKVRV